jgi:hypothetical protein
MHSQSIFANRHSARNRIYWQHILKRAISYSVYSRHYGCISFSFNSPIIAAGVWSIGPHTLNEHSTETSAKFTLCTVSTLSQWIFLLLCSAYNWTQRTLGQKRCGPTPFSCTAFVLYAMTSDMVTRKLLLKFRALVCIVCYGYHRQTPFFVGWMCNIHTGINRRT